MAKYIFLTILAVFLSLNSVYAGFPILDAPHNQNNSSKKMSCTTCHSYSLWWQYSPAESIPNRDLDFIEPLCFSCHNSDNGFTSDVVTHSSLQLNFMHRSDLAPFSKNCLDCHDPHFQGQLFWRGDASVPDSELFLVQGSMTADTLEYLANTSTFTYSVIDSKPLWEDPATWSEKTGPGRGLLMVFRDTTNDYSYEVESATEDSQYPGTGTVTVNGIIDSSLFNGANFGLIYGQLIRNEISVDPDKDGQEVMQDVKFFDAKGGFVNETMEGICQVCHADGSTDQTMGTRHFQYNQWPDSHINIRGVQQADTLKCTGCHFHDKSFGHGADEPSLLCTECHDNTNDDGSSAKHVEHLALAISCYKCHDINNMRTQDGSILLDETNTSVCADRCHHDATDLDPSNGNNPPAVDTFIAGWGNPNYTFPADCTGCHLNPPEYLTDFPKKNSHVKHVIQEGFKCDYCHYTTTQDNGVSLVASTSTHTNNVYDIAPDPALNITIDFTYVPGGSSTCSINGTGTDTCHNGINAEWGTSLPCESCHISISTINESSAHVRINLSEWETTGHGRPSDENYAVTNNPGAGMACYYCHRETVPHNDPINPFKLANISDPQDGMNGVCWVCHKTDSTGYSPPEEGGLPLINSTVAADINSFHESLPVSGGQFCWDCHDPHGDSNIVMIHDRVVTESDNITGEPLAYSSKVIFTNKAVGTDFAVRTVDNKPFTGICNVCHVAELTYKPFAFSTTFGSSSHNPTNQSCTTWCHKHNGPSPNQAFSEGDCVNCHNTAQQIGATSETRRPITTEFPATEETTPGAVHGHFGAELDHVDCRVCHDFTDHRSGQIVLIDADLDLLYRGANVDELIAINTTDRNFDDISDFCMSCHDSDGATRLQDPKDPFGNGNAPPNVADKFKGWLGVPEYYGDYSTGTMGSGRKVMSHHPLSHADQSDLSGSSGLPVRLECTDCHSAHGASLTTKLADPDLPSQPWVGSNNGFCLACHDGGSNPTLPEFPDGVAGPWFKTYYTPGEPCIDYYGQSGIYDCANNCVLASDIYQPGGTSLIGDGYCDDGSTIISPSNNFDLRCDFFINDDGDCGPVSLEGGYSLLSGIDSCDSYSQFPWLVSMNWSDAPHGGGSKRSWPGYQQTPEVPSYELDCITCHDPHGSWSPTNPSGNVYMIRDFIDGSQFADDGYREPETEKLGCTDNGDGTLTCEQYGTMGPVKILSPSHNQQQSDYMSWAAFCSKCHANWQVPAKNALVHGKIDANGNFINAGMYNSCLSCHAHGAAWGNRDWNAEDRFDVAPINNAPPCPPAP